MKDETGFCGSPYRPIVASSCAHMGEEPPISGSRGSGAIFFANCNLRCVYCQNYQISQQPEAFARRPGSVESLADTMLQLQNEKHCHNINLVSPSHYVPQIVQALCLAIPRGLRLPLVYNTNAYDSIETLHALDGIVDIYLPDIKYSSARVAARLSGAHDYVEVAQSAIVEMCRQVGVAVILDDEETVVRGVIVRHLVLPGGLAGSSKSLQWLADAVSTEVTLSIMSQYRPSHRALDTAVLSRPVNEREYGNVIQVAQSLRFDHVWAQHREAVSHYVPDFLRPGHPFE